TPCPHDQPRAPAASADLEAVVRATLDCGEHLDPLPLPEPGGFPRAARHDLAVDRHRHATLLDGRARHLDRDLDGGSIREDHGLPVELDVHAIPTVVSEERPANR